MHLDRQEIFNLLLDVPCGYQTIMMSYLRYFPNIMLLGQEIIPNTKKLSHQKQNYFLFMDIPILDKN